MPFILCCCQWWARTFKKETVLPKRWLFNNSNNIGFVDVCWMYCLWQKRLSCIASPYHFQYSSFAGYWKVAKHSGFYPLFFFFLYFGIRVASFLIFGFVLLIIFGCTVSRPISLPVLSKYCCQFLLWCLMAYAFSIPFTLLIQTVTSCCCCSASSWEAPSLPGQT